MSIKNSTQAFSQNAEIIAADFLVKKGFKIRAQNFRYKRFEIDLIAQKGRLIVFVEVKARKNNLFGHPEDFVNHKKMNFLRLAATHYLRINNEEESIRFDIISVLGNIDQITEIVHFEDGFY